MPTSNNALLQVKNLKTHFFLDEGTVKAVEGADLTIQRGGTLGVVGESGCGKSVMSYSILQLVESPGRIVAGQVLFQRKNKADGQAAAMVDLATLSPDSREMRAIRGDEIAMIFQEPMTSLSPVHTIGNQIEEVIQLHRHVDHAGARQQAIEMLHRVGIPKPADRVDAYPFQLSGGMRQRAMIAMALSCQPSLLIADEPTTALDVTTQAQILELIQGLQRDMGMAVMLITHNLGMVAEICEDIVVMYLGEVVERSDIYSLFREPLHPYTQALLRSIPRLGQVRHGRLDPIQGSVPDPYNRPTGCPFHPRCPQMMPGRCDRIHPDLLEQGERRAVRCLLYGEPTGNEVK